MMRNDGSDTVLEITLEAGDDEGKFLSLTIQDEDGKEILDLFLTDPKEATEMSTAVNESINEFLKL